MECICFNIVGHQETVALDDADKERRSSHHRSIFRPVGELITKVGNRAKHVGNSIEEGPLPVDDSRHRRIVGRGHLIGRQREVGRQRPVLGEDK